MILFKYPSLSPHRQFTNLKSIRISQFEPKSESPCFKAVRRVFHIGRTPHSLGRPTSNEACGTLAFGTEPDTAPCVPRPRAVCAPQKMANLVVMLLVVPAFDCVPCRTERRYSVPGLPVVASYRKITTTGGVVELRACSPRQPRLVSHH